MKIRSDYAQIKEFWSYKFPISSIDDFQIGIKNVNPLPAKTFGWSINENQFFVRVNISPGQDDDATLFITFTHPSKVFRLKNIVYPEYVFFNNT